MRPEVFADRFSPEKVRRPLNLIRHPEFERWLCNANLGFLLNHIAVFDGDRAPFSIVLMPTRILWSELLFMMFFSRKRLFDANRCSLDNCTFPAASTFFQHTHSILQSTSRNSRRLMLIALECFVVRSERPDFLRRKSATRSWATPYG